MDPRMLDYYNRELQYMREMGGEFAKQFPKIAGRLGMSGIEVADPYVERLLEGFAFLAARIQLKLADEFPLFCQHLLEMVYPQYLSPTPSMAVVRLEPNPREGSLDDGVLVPRGTTLRGLLGKEEQTACEYRTAHDVTLWPIELGAAEYRDILGGIAGLPASESRRARALFRLELRTTAGQSFDSLPIHRLPIFIRGGLDVSAKLYEQLLGHGVSVWARTLGSSGSWSRIEDEAPILSVGFDDSEALLPCGPRSFQGYRLLHEYFAFPERFGFVAINGLTQVLPRCPGEALELVCLLDAAEPSLEGAVDGSLLALFCTPAINLFPRKADRIHLSNAQHEYHVVPDRTRPMDLEVHSVTDVVGYGASATTKRQFHPFYAHSKGAWDEPAYYMLRREQRRLSTGQRAKGPRSSYVGSETFIALVDGHEGPFRSDLKQLALETLCTNRDLPLHMPLNRGRTDFTLESGAPVASVRCVAGPTSPRPSHAHGSTAWRLVSHLSLNYLSISDGAPLRELLMLYADMGATTTRGEIESVRSVSSAPVFRRLPGRMPFAVARGVEITLTCDESGFHGSSVFLLGAVLERFFAKYTSLNSFTETVLKTIQRGEIMRWPARTGQAHVV